MSAPPSMRGALVAVGAIASSNRGAGIPWGLVLAVVWLAMAASVSAVTEEKAATSWVEPSAVAISLKASQEEALRPLAEELARHLRACSGLDFPVQVTPSLPSKGIRLAIVDAQTPDGIAAKLKPLNEEGILLEGTTEGVAIHGNSRLAVQEGMFCYLEKLGFRFWFPNEAWHVVPKTRALYADFSLLTAPDYVSRKFSYAYGTDSPKADADYEQWNRANRMGGALDAQCGHAWLGIVDRNKAEFEKHPEYFAQGSRTRKGSDAPTKFCVSNEGLVQLCIQDAFQRIESPRARKPRPRKGEEAVPVAPPREVQMISMDASDGSGRCSCPACQKIGDASAQVFHLANRVAKAVREKFPGRWVGLYAYNDHAAPPPFDLEPNLFVQVATAYNQSRYTYDELFAMWSKKVTCVGVREYYGVATWDRDLPGQMRGAKLDYLKRTIPRFHKLGASSLNAESCVGWISKGLGQYVASRLLWDVRADVGALWEDFFDRAFGKARKPMEELFLRWQARTNKVPTSHDVAVMLRLAQEAVPLAEGDEAVRRRVDQVRMYVHFVARYCDWNADADEGEASLAKFDQLAGFLHRVRDLGACATQPVLRRIASNKNAPTSDRRFNQPSAPWKKDASPVSREELDRLVAADQARFKELKWLRDAEYADTFRVAGDGSPDLPPLRLRGDHVLLVQVPAQGDRALSVAFGQIRKSQKTGTVRVYRPDQEIDEEANDTPALAAEFPCDEKENAVDLGALKPGAWRVKLGDHRNGLVLKAGASLGWSLVADSENPLWTTGRNRFYFYVPKGTAKFAVVHSGPFNLRTPHGTRLGFEDAKESLVEVDVPPGEHGVWQATDQAGRLHFLGIPALVSTSARGLLVPSNVP